MTCPTTPIWKFNYVYCCLKDNRPIDLTLFDVPETDAEAMWGDGSTVRYSAPKLMSAFHL